MVGWVKYDVYNELLNELTLGKVTIKVSLSLSLNRSVVLF